MLKTYLRPYIARMAAVQGVETPLVRWGVVVILLVVFWSIVLMPYLEWRDQRIELLTSRLSKVERLLGLQHAAHAWKEAETVYESADKEIAGQFFQGSSYAMAQTDLLNLLRKQYGQRKLVLESQRLLESELQSGVGEQIGLNLNLRGKLADVLTFLDDLAAFDKIIVVKGLYITKAGKQGARLQLELIGFRLQPLQPVEGSDV